MRTPSSPESLAVIIRGRDESSEPRAPPGGPTAPAHGYAHTWPFITGTQSGGAARPPWCRCRLIYCTWLGRRAGRVAARSCFNARLKDAQSAAWHPRTAPGLRPCQPFTSLPPRWGPWRHRSITSQFSGMIFIGGGRDPDSVSSRPGENQLSAAIRPVSRSTCDLPSPGGVSGGPQGVGDSSCSSRPQLSSRHCSSPVVH